MSSDYLNGLVSCYKKLVNTQFFSLLPSLLLGVSIWFGVTPSDELSMTAIHLLAVFAR